jgi:hypothetical protein
MRVTSRRHSWHAASPGRLLQRTPPVRRMRQRSGKRRERPEALPAVPLPPTSPTGKMMGTATTIPEKTDEFMFDGVDVALPIVHVERSQGSSRFKRRRRKHAPTSAPASAPAPRGAPVHLADRKQPHSCARALRLHHAVGVSARGNIAGAAAGSAPQSGSFVSTPKAHSPSRQRSRLVVAVSSSGGAPHVLSMYTFPRTSTGRSISDVGAALTVLLRKRLLEALPSPLSEVVRRLTNDAFVRGESLVKLVNPVEPIALVL